MLTVLRCRQPVADEDGSAAGSASSSGGPALRAARFAQVAAHLYDAGGASLRLPLGGDHPLVAVVAAALGRDLAAPGSARPSAAEVRS